MDECTCEDGQTDPDEEELRKRRRRRRMLLMANAECQDQGFFFEVKRTAVAFYISSF